MSAWLWLALGIGLVSIELFATHLVSVWLGLAAIAVSIMVYGGGLVSPSDAVVVWAILSMLFTAAWFSGRHYYVKRQLPGSVYKMEKGLVGLTGLLIDFNPEQLSGHLRFTPPVFERAEWPVVATHPLQSGERVVVLRVLTPQSASVKNTSLPLLEVDYHHPSRR